MSDRPKVSYVCSVRNGDRDIRRCARSVLGQSLREIELLIVDDHSSDSTWAAISSLAEEDPRVRGIRNRGAKGLTYSLNLGLDFARGEYVARIDADDFAHRDRTARQVALMESSPSAAMCATCYRVVDMADWELYCHCPAGDPSLLRWSLCFRNNIRHSTAMWRKSLDVRYEPSFTYAQDYDMWCRISTMGDIVVLPAVVATIRTGPGSVTSTKHEEQEAAADRVAAARYEHYTGSPITPAQARHLRMLHHMKSSEQFAEMEKIASEDFRSAVERYFRLAEAFRRRESPETEGFMREIRNDIMSLMKDQSRRPDTAAAMERMSRLLGVSSVAAEAEKSATQK